VAQRVERWETAGQAWIGLLRYVWTTGEAGLDDRGPVIEAPPRLFEIMSLSWDDEILREYGDTARIARYTAKFTRTTVVPGFKYSYGARLRRLQGVDQLRWAVDLLRARPWSKSAWVSLTVPDERPDAVPCLTAVSFRIRRTRVNMTAAFRSQNALTSYLNYVPLRAVQDEVANGLGLPAGLMRVFVDVPHVYVSDADEVAAILTAVGP
jgi:thymidylate synthase